jgi:hypothetical protein
VLLFGNVQRSLLSLVGNGIKERLANDEVVERQANARVLNLDLCQPRAQAQSKKTATYDSQYGLVVGEVGDDNLLATDGRVARGAVSDISHCDEVALPRVKSCDVSALPFRPRGYTEDRLPGLRWWDRKRWDLPLSKY